MSVPTGERPCVLVTGASRNIGRAIALAFAAAGYRVAAAARDAGSLEALRSAWGEGGKDPDCFTADLAVPTAGRSLVQAVLHRCGRIDVLVANAAIRPRQEYLAIGDADWREVMQVNLTSLFEMTQAALPSMVARGGGRIIAIGGLDAHVGNRNRAHVVAAKAGATGLVKALAQDVSHHGITVNNVAPGVIDTERDWSNYPELARALERRTARLPVRRLGRVEEVAAACLYLASPQAGYLTGQTIHLNGGEVCF